MTGAGVVLGIDAGQTKARAAISGSGPHPPRPGPVVPGVRRLDGGSVDAADVAAALVAAGEAAADGTEGVEAVAVGLSGFEVASAGELEAVAAALRARFGGAARVALASDAVTSLLGALGVRPGVVVAAGTGAVTLGRDGNGRWAKVDGWGSLLGDAGSGYWIGRAGLEAALRWVDRRAGGSEALAAAADEAYGTAAEAPTAVHRAHSTSTAMAAFAPRVAACAAAGDPVATGIWERAGDALAEAADAAIGRLFGAEAAGVPVACVGGLFDAGALLGEPFAAGLARRRPGARIVPAAGGSLEGAVELARADGVAAEPGLLWWAP